MFHKLPVTRKLMFCDDGDDNDYYYYYY